MAWKHPTSPVAKKFKSQPPANKIMFSLFWNMEGAILVHFTPKGETVNSQNYCDVLRTKLKPAIQKLARCKIRYRRNQKTFFLTELKKLVKHWNRCVEVEGDNVEK
jgi:hypothetical protein